MDSTEVVIVGAGVVGLAVARSLAQGGCETVVLERHARPGQETTSRNSGVIHAGLYYPAGSLKARLCVSGRRALYDFCAARGVAHRRCGKIIVAHAAQVPALLALQARAVTNGVEDLALLDAAQVRELESAVRCAAALLSPSTGIVDVHELLLALVADFESAGGALVMRAPFDSARVVGDGLAVRYGADAREEIACRWLVNCAGLSATDLLQRVADYPSNRVRRHRYAKGSYFALRGSRPFSRLVYPMPNEAGLGTHATLDLDGSVRFGPDVEWLEQPDFHVDPTRAPSFYDTIREYWPEIPPGSLTPAYAGVRPKLVGPGEPSADFTIEGPAAHGVAGLVNLLGIESPGLTSALAIGAEVLALVRSAR